MQPSPLYLWARFYAVIFAVAGIAAASTAAEPRFGFDNVAEIARKAAAEAFKEPRVIPEYLTDIGYDDYRDVRFDTAQSLWRDGGRFQVQFIHPGLYYKYGVPINVIDRNGVQRVPFSTKMFNYGRNKFTDKIPGDLGFAGFRLAYPFYKSNEYNHVIVFAGASYFRAVAKNEVFGLSARGLALDTGLPSGEEFPVFREFWLERPTRDARTARVYALLDSPSVAGAYEFTIQPGDRTIVGVRLRLYERKRAKELGIAPLTSMFFYGEEKPRPAAEWRPEVHDSDGLAIASAAGEWIWRPLTNPQKLKTSYFEIENPSGFGLLQRDRDFHDYEDLETRHELRPNAWVVPSSAWGKGQIKLVEIPSQKEINDNIVAYWIPRNLPPVGKPIDLGYTIYFQSAEPMASQGRVIATRVGAGDKDDAKRLVVDFEGAKLKALPAGAPVKAVISVGPDGQLVNQTAFKNSVTGGWRISFQVKTPKEKPLELRAFLQENNQQTLTETWSYQLEP
ncbi:MAG TPA: glucan biosynthesis protein G [Verrucomicrobiae bacterium]|jgi:glucans biosynthesis protein|nr:glucan biosynthesis protein G [Verrucomicrobiae bacterium]